MFYIKAPTGQISFHILEKCILDRLEYLQLLYENKSHEFNGDFEYLLENSAYDKIGHFILRLFLKYGGMQLEDAINYWKEEYSKPHTCSSTCSHNWQMNERKFIYSIRHFYGLEGSKKNYKSPSCKMMCTSASSPIYEGGCPFKNFDINILKNLLCLSLSNDYITKVLNTISSQNPQTACAEFFKILNQKKKIILLLVVFYNIISR
ncbi:probable DNA primase large subunit [Apis florea]|uniref:probable DNA primase large subunit n=1 Tax=Apis florea TaxID=7463 RepID=UPI0012FEDA71|nr:probable DNA primase large subunit [Apis florea]